MRPASRARRTVFAAVISIGSALLALYALEVALAFATPAWIDKLGTTLRKGPNVVGETRRLRKEGVQAYPYLQPDTFADSANALLRVGDTTILPLSGIAGALTILCNESGTTIGYRSDSLGFRNSNDAWGMIGPRVALVGDSFAHGFCRPEREGTAALLRAAGVNTLNAGLTGAGPLAELGVVREYLSTMRPSIVLWLFYEGNDLIDITSERETLLSHYLEPGFSQNLMARRQGVSDAMRAYADSAIRAHPEPGPIDRLEAFVKLRRLRTALGIHAGVRQASRRDESRDLAMLRQILSAADRDVRAWGGELRLVYLPERRRFNRRTPAVVGENHDPRDVERSVMAIAADAGIPVINVAAAFAETPDPVRLWNARRYHYNRQGYEVVAKAILSDLARNPPGN